jgi:hypothetical protein
MNTMKNKRWVQVLWTFLLAFCIVGMTSCDDRATGEELAKAGMSAANNLANYYESLAQDTLDTWEMEAFLSSLRQVSFDATQQKPLQEQIDALKSRARLARALASTYGALQQLSSYDASAEMKGAAEKLAQEVKAIPVLPKSTVDPSSLFGSLAGDIAAWRQSGDIRKGSKLLLEADENILKLFKSEKEACDSIPEERGNKIAAVIEHLIKKKMVVSWSLLQKETDALNLPWVSAQEPVEDNVTIEAMIELARVRMKRLAFISASAGDSISQSLESLIENHKSFQDKKGLNLEGMLTLVQKAQSYLDEISKLRTEKK